MRKYELATSLHFRYDRSCQIPITREIEQIHRCGFTYLDFNFLDMCIHPNSDFLRDDYLTWLEGVRACGDSLGVKFVQAHAPCESVYNPQDYDLLFTLCQKALRGCAVLGIPWMAFHPSHARRFGNRFPADMTPFDFNLHFFGSLLPLAEELGVGMAVENVVPFYPGESAADITDHMIELIDTINSPYMGATWDFGHAHLCQTVEGAEDIAHQSVQLIKLGSRLKCTHVHDNNSGRIASRLKLFPNQASMALACFDEHIQPFAGDIDWQDAITGLDTIGYDRYFTFEAHHAANTLPDSIADDGITQLYKIGQSILAMSCG